MKFYSELLNKVFDSADACEIAEKKYTEEKEAEEAKKKELANSVSKEKKELSIAIEAAESNLNKAYDDYEVAKEEVRKILEESNQKALDILNPAKEAIKKAQEEKYQAISVFNKRFGLYTTQYTGDRAYKELKRATSWINDLFKFF